MIFEVVNANASHIEPIAARIRQSDLNEVWAIAAVIARPALELSLKTSEVARTWLVDGVPEAMGGIVRKGDDGIIWLLATDAVEKYPRVFLLASLREFKAVRDRYGLLYNSIDARNSKSIAWLRWLGFEVEEENPYGILGKPFHYFSWRKIVGGVTGVAQHRASGWNPERSGRSVQRPISPGKRETVWDRATDDQIIQAFFDANTIAK